MHDVVVKQTKNLKNNNDKKYEKIFFLFYFRKIMVFKDLKLCKRNDLTFTVF